MLEHEGEEEYTYEELTVLGEVVGTVSRGLSTADMASLPIMTWRAAAASASTELDDMSVCVLQLWLEHCLVCIR